MARPDLTLPLPLGAFSVGSGGFSIQLMKTAAMWDVRQLTV